MSGAGAGTPAAGASDADAVHDGLERDHVVALPGGDNAGGRPATTIRGEVDFGGQPTPRAPQRLSIMLGAGNLVVR
jgi:hypothetical protein